MRLTLSLVFITSLWLLSSSGCAPASADPVADSKKAREIRVALLKKADAAAADTGAAEVGPAGFASLKGQFVLGAGEVEIKLLNVTKDQDICAPGGQMPRDNSLLVDSATRGIADIVVFARKTKNKHESATMPEEPEVVFDQKECLFLSPVLVAQVGQTIQVKNSDPTGHNTNIAGTSFNNTIPVGTSSPFEVKTQTEVAKDVTCNIHPWMKAYMWFRKDGYFALTKKDGTFEIANLPAGEPIEFQVWHARARNGLALEKPEVKWDAKGRFKVTLQADTPFDLGKLDVPASRLAGG